MKKKFLTILFIAFSISKLSGQLDFYIKTISVSNVKVTISPISHMTQEYEGPDIKVDFCLHNKTDDTLELFFEKPEFFLEFRYNNKTYFEKQIVFFKFKENDIIIKPHSTIEGFIVTSIFRSTDIHKPYRYGVNDYYDLDYTKEIMEVLPTIRILFIDKGKNVKFYTNRIKRVEYKEWEPWWHE